MEMAQDCNQRKFGTTLSAFIHPPKTGFRATETAINGALLVGHEYPNSTTAETSLSLAESFSPDARFCPDRYPSDCRRC